MCHWLKKGCIRNTDFKHNKLSVEIENIAANSLQVDVYREFKSSSADQMFQWYTECVRPKTQVKKRKQTGRYMPALLFIKWE